MRLYAAFFGFVSHPMPRGTLSPMLCRMCRFHDVRAEMRRFSDGTRMPNFMIGCPRCSRVGASATTAGAHLAGSSPLLSTVNVLNEITTVYHFFSTS